jgi:hypothetical protein
MNDPFHKFPHTPHLLWLGEGGPREDKIFPRTEAAAFLEGEVIVEEKVDGANLGLSLGPDGRLRAQSRGNYLNPAHCHAQWKPLWPWLARHEDALLAALGDGILLFGEWCHARHTIPYDALPDWFLAFDVYEPATKQFWSTDRRNALVRTLGIEIVPEICRDRLSLHQVPTLLQRSKLGSVPAEGTYLRREAEGLLHRRAKVVAPAFQQQIEEHWTRRPLVPNRLNQPQKILA